MPPARGPSSVAASRTAVFVANQITGDLSVYQVGPEGGLTSAGISVPTGGSPTSVAVDPTGNYVYVANQLQLVVFNTMPNGPYPLTFVRSYNAGLTPSYVAVDPDGNFVYVVSPGSNDVSGFAVSSGGTAEPHRHSLRIRRRWAAIAHGAPHRRQNSDLALRRLSSRDRSLRNPVNIQWRHPGHLETRHRSTGRGHHHRQRLHDRQWDYGIGLPPPASSSSSTASTQYLPVGSNLIQIAYNPARALKRPPPCRFRSP